MNREIHELLPFYVNGSLDEREKERIEAAIITDPSLRDEIEFLSRLRDEVKSQELAHSPGELGLKRLQKAMAEDRLRADPVARAQSRIAREQNNVWRVAAIAACLILLLQTTAMLYTARQDDLGAAGGAASQRAGGQTIQVTFSPDAREENIRALLLGVDAMIIDGPSALGVYTISVRKDAAGIVEKLRAHQNLVESAAIDGARGAEQ